MVKDSLNKNFQHQCRRCCIEITSLKVKYESIQIENIFARFFDFLSQFFADLKTNLSKSKLSTTFRS